MIRSAPRHTIAWARIFRALGDPTRLTLLHALAQREQPVTEMVLTFGLPQPAVSRHLRVLREAGLVEDERRARFIVYRLTPGAREHLPAIVQRLLSPVPGDVVPAPPLAGEDDVTQPSSVLFVD